MKLLTLSERKLIVLLQVMNNSVEINYYFKNNCLNKIGMFVTRIKTLLDMEELKKVQELRIDESPRTTLIENQ